jgi:hypothetical protein
MFEHVTEPLLPRRAFLVRLLRHAGGAGLVLGGSLLVGILGYRLLDDLSWIDAFLNASMILGGMGPVDPLKNDAAKLFAGVYALYSGVVFLVAVGIVFAPLLHRVLHKLHVQTPDPDPDGSEDKARSSGSKGSGTGSSAT